mgnify:CR=1 FL=1
MGRPLRRSHSPGSRCCRIWARAAGIKFRVDVDEKEEAVLAALPGNNCGGKWAGLYAGAIAQAAAVAGFGPAAGHEAHHPAVLRPIVIIVLSGLVAVPHAGHEGGIADASSAAGSPLPALGTGRIVAELE